MRVTYKAHHALTASGKNHPQAPPLHVHFIQSESFQVLSGCVGTTEGYDVQDIIWTPSMTTTPHEITPNIPHKFWPVPDCEEDSTILLWAHPDGSDEDMDRIFFGNLLRYMSDVHAKKVTMDPFRMMLMQHETASALVMFPTATWLGSLRWWIPWKLQAFAAAVADWRGTGAVMKEYTDEEDWVRMNAGKKKIL